MAKGAGLQIQKLVLLILVFASGLRATVGADGLITFYPSSEYSGVSGYFNSVGSGGIINATITFPPPPFFFGCSGAPTNDLFANAQLLNGTDISVSGTTGCSGVEAGEPTHVGYTNSYSVWYRWIAPGAGTVSINATKVQTSTSIPLDPTVRFGVYAGSAINSLTNVLDVLTNVIGLTPAFAAARGQEYWIQVDAGSQGFTLNLKLEQLRLITSPEKPLAGQTKSFEIVPSDSADVLTEVTASVAGVEVGTVTNAPFTFEVRGETNGAVTVTAVGRTSTGEILHLESQKIYFRPANDDFAAAIALPNVMLGQPQYTSSAEATLEPGEPQHPGRVLSQYSITIQPSGSAWWKWTPSRSTPAVLQVGSGDVAIYKGTGLTDLSLVAHAYSQTTTLVVHAWDLFSTAPLGGGWGGLPGETSALGPTFTAEAGATYWIAELSNSAGNSWSIYQQIHLLELTIGPEGTPARFYLRGDNTAAAPESVSLGIYYQSGGYSSLVLSTNIVNPQNELWSWDSPASGAYIVSFQANYAGGGSWSENYGFVVRPANDDFKTASNIEMRGGATNLSFNLAQATTEPGEPLVGTNTPTGSLWWRWTPSENKRVRVSAPCGSGGLPVDIFTGETLTNLVRLGNNDERANMPPFAGLVPLNAVAGETYFIRASATAATSSTYGILVIEPLDAPMPGVMLLSTAVGGLRNDGTIEWHNFGRVLTSSGEPATNDFILAQFYIGTNLSALRPYGGWSGILGPRMGQPPELAGVANQGVAWFAQWNAGQNLWVQLRAWDSGGWGPYESARVDNRAVGRSALLYVKLGSELDGPTILTNIGDVVLTQSAEGFAPATIGTDGVGAFRLKGSPGLYGIESSDLSQAWTNELILTNVTGEAAFTVISTNAVKVFRSRLLD